MHARGVRQLVVGPGAIGIDRGAGVECSRATCRAAACGRALAPAPGHRALAGLRRQLGFEIECHYFVNGGFFEVEDQLLRDAPRLANIPGTIVHGRYDVVCPPQNAWDLHQAWPKATLEITSSSGHSAFEAENVDALVRATDAYA
jgi:pimeloyl-ACP methyl ester carboxylesterase